MQDQTSWTANTLFTLLLILNGTMADYSFGGSDEENAELKKLNAEVVSPSQESSICLPDIY